MIGHTILLDLYRTTLIILLCDHEQDGQFIVKGEEPAGSGKYVSIIRGEGKAKSRKIRGYQNQQQTNVDDGLSNNELEKQNIVSHSPKED